MKYSIIILTFFILNSYLGQYPKLMVNERGQIYNANAYTQTQFDSIHVFPVKDTGSYWYIKYVKKDTVWRMFDTLKVIMQVSDTLRSAWDTKIYWMKGYKVLGDYDTYYLDILKQPLRKSIIVWLDQNL